MRVFAFSNYKSWGTVHSSEGCKGGSSQIRSTRFSIFMKPTGGGGRARTLHRQVLRVSLKLYIFWRCQARISRSKTQKIVMVMKFLSSPLGFRLMPIYLPLFRYCANPVRISTTAYEPHCLRPRSTLPPRTSISFKQIFDNSSGGFKAKRYSGESSQNKHFQKSYLV